MPLPLGRRSPAPRRRRLTLEAHVRLGATPAPPCACPPRLARQGGWRPCRAHPVSCGPRRRPLIRRSPLRAPLAIAAPARAVARR